MDSKTKKVAVIALILGVVSIAFLAVPIQAYVNGTENGDSLQTQDRDKDRLRVQDQDRTCDCARAQYGDRQRANECATNRICNCTMSLEQYRYQYRNQNGERTEA